MTNVNRICFFVLMLAALYSGTLLKIRGKRLFYLQKALLFLYFLLYRADAKLFTLSRLTTFVVTKVSLIITIPIVVFSSSIRYFSFNEGRYFPAPRTSTINEFAIKNEPSFEREICFLNMCGIFSIRDAA